MKLPIVFLGPSLDRDSASHRLKADYRPPVAQGDLYQAARERPAAIAIIDGYFERLPAVWHKEGLWALSRGVPLFGASSMGALRAAELQSFGMVGVGAIFEAVMSGELEDDDEVAVAHGDAESSYRPLSDALVNIRATLNAARSARVISEATEQALVAMARRPFYPDRSYRALLAAAQQANLPHEELRALEAFLPEGRVDQKRLDAELLLDHVRGFLAAGGEFNRPRFHFSHTEAWEQVVAEAAQRAPGAAAQRTSGSGERGEGPLDVHPPAASGTSSTAVGEQPRELHRGRDELALLEELWLDDAMGSQLLEHIWARFMARPETRESLEQLASEALLSEPDGDRVRRRAADKARLLAQEGERGPIANSELGPEELRRWVVEQLPGTHCGRLLGSSGSSQRGDLASIGRACQREYRYRQLLARNWKF